MASDTSSATASPSSTPPSSPPSAAPSAAPSGDAKPSGSPPAAPSLSAVEKSDPAIQAHLGVSGFDAPRSPSPFSVTVSMEKKAPGSVGPFEGSAKVSITAERKTEVTAGADGPKAADKKSVTVSEEQKFGGNVPIGKFGVQASFGSGTEAKLEVSTPAGGPGDADPRDPDGMPVGSKVTFTGQGKGTEGSGVTYGDKLGKGFSAGVGASDSLTWSSGVTYSAQKVDDHTIRVTAGGVDGVSDAFGGNANLKFEMGPISAKASLGVQSVNAETDQHLETRDIDLNNPVGRQTYMDLVAGRAGLPAADPAKGIREGHVDSYAVTQETGASVEATLNGFGIKPGKLTLASASGAATLTRAADGTSDLVHTLRFGDQTLSVDRKFGADGVEDVSKRRLDLLMTNVGPDASPFLVNMAQANKNRVAGSFAKGTNDFQLSLTPADLQQMKAMAGSPALANRNDGFLKAMASLDTGDLSKVFEVLGNRNDVAAGLSRMAMGTLTPVPGKMWLRSQDNGGVTLRLR